MRRFLAAGQVDKGSIDLKVAAPIEFLEDVGTEGVITDPLHLAPALAGRGDPRSVAD